MSKSRMTKRAKNPVHVCGGGFTATTPSASGTATSANDPYSVASED